MNTNLTELNDPGFSIDPPTEQPRILTWRAGGCRPATPEECLMWDALFALGVAPKAIRATEIQFTPEQRASLCVTREVSIPGAAPAPTSGGEPEKPDAHSSFGSPENTNNLGGESLTTASAADAGWVSIAHGLPAKDVQVLVYRPDGKFGHFAIDEWGDLHESPVSWSSATIVVGEGWSNHEYEEVTHWKPLAAPHQQTGDAPPDDYKAMFGAAVASLAQISEALGIDEEEAACANGNQLILEAIAALGDMRNSSAEGEREKFEAWAKRRGMYLGFQVDRETYSSTGTADAWAAWKARASTPSTTDVIAPDAVSPVDAHSPASAGDVTPLAGVAVGCSQEAVQRDPHFGGHSYDASLLRELLCVIHRDGGHYIAEHGIEKAADDAADIFRAALSASRSSASTKAEGQS